MNPIFPFRKTWNISFVDEMLYDIKIWNMRLCVKLSKGTVGSVPKLCNTKEEHAVQCIRGLKISEHLFGYFTYLRYLKCNYCQVSQRSIPLAISLFLSARLQLNATRTFHCSCNCRKSPESGKIVSSKCLKSSLGAAQDRHYPLSLGLPPHSQARASRSAPCPVRAQTSYALRVTTDGTELRVTSHTTVFRASTKASVGNTREQNSVGIPGFW